MNLELGDDGSGKRHFLDGHPISCGTQLRLRVQTSPELWVWARYEAVFHNSTVSPCFYTTFGRVVPDEETFLRWPREDER